MSDTILQLVLGVPSRLSIGASPSDFPGTLVDKPPKVIDFLEGVWKVQKTSLSGYDSGITSTKGGGVTVDSGATDGVMYLSMPVGDVPETIQLLMNPGGIQIGAALSRLNRFMWEVRQFQTDVNFPFVPYIKVKTVADAGPRYALIKDMSVQPQISPFDDSEPAAVVISLTREPYWRGLPPGDNPKRWSLENFYNLKPTQDTSLGPGDGYYDDTNIDLDSSAATDYHLFSTTIAADFGGKLRNWTANNALNTTEGFNFIIIPKERIPGDAPALCNLVFSKASGLAGQNVLHIARQADWFNMFSLRELASSETLTLSAGGNSVNGTVATGLTSTTTVAALGTGVPYSNAYYYQDVNVSAYNSGGLGQTVLNWSSGTWGARSGRYAVFVRARTTSGTTGDVDFSLQISMGSALYTNDSSVFNVTNTTDPCLHFMGVFSLPPENEGPVVRGTGDGIAGRGQLDINVKIILSTDSSATARFRFYDVIFMPLEQYAKVTEQATGSGGMYMLDGTGYMSRAREDTANRISSGDGIPMELTGQPITLIPGYDNYIYFLLDQTDTNHDSSIADYEHEAWVNIVPRWHGLRGE